MPYKFPSDLFNPLSELPSYQEFAAKTTKEWVIANQQSDQLVRDHSMMGLTYGRHGGLVSSVNIDSIISRGVTQDANLF